MGIYKFVIGDIILCLTVFDVAMQVFRQLDNDRKGKVTVFFCGPPAISNILKRKCVQ